MTTIVVTVNNITITVNIAEGTKEASSNKSSEPQVFVRNQKEKYKPNFSEHNKSEEDKQQKEWRQQWSTSSWKFWRQKQRKHIQPWTSTSEESEPGPGKHTEGKNTSNHYSEHDKSEEGESDHCWNSTTGKGTRHSEEGTDKEQDMKNKVSI